MTTLTLAQALTLFIWFMLTILLLFLLLIARLYWVISGERTFYWGYLIPIALFGIASAHSAFLNQPTSDGLSEVLWAVGGLVLIVLCAYLYRRLSAKQ